MPDAQDHARVATFGCEIDRSAKRSLQLTAKSIFLFTDGAADPKNMAKLLSSPAYAAQDWVHVLIWDYGAGRLIYLDALKKGVPIRPALLVTFIAGPIGLLVHELTCAIAQPEKNAQQT
ncbi:MAG: hypothetical protein FRX49_00235 [Trebouxia sp. A1-2]|nr:MAG: hypothetical protein FRX49_00235 [Trebouxia sp. A1-2]